MIHFGDDCQTIGQVFHMKNRTGRPAVTVPGPRFYRNLETGIIGFGISLFKKLVVNDRVPLQEFDPEGEVPPTGSNSTR